MSLAAQQIPSSARSELPVIPRGAGELPFAILVRDAPDAADLIRSQLERWQVDVGHPEASIEVTDSGFRFTGRLGDGALHTADFDPGGRLIHRDVMFPQHTGRSLSVEIDAEGASAYLNNRVSLGGEGDDGPLHDLVRLKLNHSALNAEMLKDLPAAQLAQLSVVSQILRRVADNDQAVVPTPQPMPASQTNTGVGPYLLANPKGASTARVPADANAAPATLEARPVLFAAKPVPSSNDATAPGVGGPVPPASLTPRAPQAMNEVDGTAPGLGGRGPVAPVADRRPVSMRHEVTAPGTGDVKAFADAPAPAKLPQSKTTPGAAALAAQRQPQAPARLPQAYTEPGALALHKPSAPTPVSDETTDAQWGPNLDKNTPPPRIAAKPRAERAAQPQARQVSTWPLGDAPAAAPTAPRVSSWPFAEAPSPAAPKPEVVEWPPQGAINATVRDPSVFDPPKYNENEVKEFERSIRDGVVKKAARKVWSGVKSLFGR